MTIVKRIRPISAFKVGAAVYGFLGLILGVICTVVALTGAPFAREAHMPFMRTIGIFAVVLCPIVYGIIGGIGAAISALLYNLASRWVGGLEVETG